MKNSITESNISVEKLKETMNKNIGIERSMNQAIRFVVGDLSTYLDNTQRIKKSIDKIIMKSKFVVGYKCFYYWTMSFIHSKALLFASKTNSCPLAAEIKQSSFQEFAL